MAKAKVAILRTKPDSVVADYQRLCELAGIREALDPGATTILKDNITWHYAFPGVNTTPWQLEGTILGLRDAGFDDLVGVHNKTVVTNPFKGEKNLKLGAVYQKHKIPIKFNFREQDTRWILYQPKFQTIALHKVFPEGILIPEYFQGKNIVHLPTVKTHSYTSYTGALKNAFGGLLNTRRHYTHTWIHETLVDLLAISKEIHTGLFATMDGTTAGSGPGPRTVRPHDKDVILASADQVAIDSVAARLMGFDWRELPCIQLADARGLGVGDPAEIELVGAVELAGQRWTFEVGTNFATGAGRLFWHDTPLKHLQKLFFHTPLVNVFVLGSAWYHDLFWYPLLGRPVVDNWKHNSPWGRKCASLP